MATGKAFDGKMLATLAAVFSMASAFATTWHVDSKGGNDAAAGTSPATAWKTLRRVNRAKIAPGDKVLFKRGGLWRGTLRPASGEEGKPVVYSWYGKGPKPILQQSVDKSKPSDWVEESPGIWATKTFKPEPLEQIWDGTACEKWNASWSGGDKGTLRRVSEDGETFLRVNCTAKQKNQYNLIQVWGPKFDSLPDGAILRLKARSTKPFRLRAFEIMAAQPPWTRAMQGDVPQTDLGGDWKTIDVFLSGSNDVESPALHFSLGDVLPEGAVFDFVPVGLWRAKFDASAVLKYDVGIFICDHGKRWGVKKWSNPEWKVEPLVNQLDYTYDTDRKRVLVRFDGNPGKAFSSIELAKTATVVNEEGCHDVVFDGLAVRYTGAHGFGGGNTQRITIRNCDIYWIGGGLGNWNRDPKTGKILYPSRFGNGIEFWGHCRNNLVERNRLWQIYDAALTNQTLGNPLPELDIVWRDNVVWQAEYSFEYWNHDPTSRTCNILVEHNTFVDAGDCWSHGQRPNPNGAHLMLYDNPAPTTNFVVRNNIFVRTTDRSTRMFNDWRVKNPAAHDGLEMDGNLYFMPENKIFELHVSGLDRKLNPKARPMGFGSGEDEFARYKSETGLDANSVWGLPVFVNPSKRDYRLKPGSFGTKLATDGGPLGARNMPGLDKDQSSVVNSR